MELQVVLSKPVNGDKVRQLNDVFGQTPNPHLYATDRVLKEGKGKEDWLCSRVHDVALAVSLVAQDTSILQGRASPWSDVDRNYMTSQQSSLGSFDAFCSNTVSASGSNMAPGTSALCSTFAPNNANEQDGYPPGPGLLAPPPGFHTRPQNPIKFSDPPAYEEYYVAGGSYNQVPFCEANVSNVRQFWGKEDKTSNWDTFSFPNTYQGGANYNNDAVGCRSRHSFLHYRGEEQLGVKGGLGLHVLQAHFGNNDTEFKNLETPSVPEEHNTTTLQEMGKSNSPSSSFGYYESEESGRKCAYRLGGPIKPTISIDPTLSKKIFLGGIPMDAQDRDVLKIFQEMDDVSVHVEWPRSGDGRVSRRCGYTYVVVDHRYQIRELLRHCQGSFGNWFLKVMFKPYDRRLKIIQVIPWDMKNNHCIMPNHNCGETNEKQQDYTLFVGGLHGRLSAENIANIFDGLFGNVVRSELDTDRWEYPLGVAQVIMNCKRSYIKALEAHFVVVQAPNIEKKIQIEPYLTDDQQCSGCNQSDGYLFCRHFDCLRYFCLRCFRRYHIGIKDLKSHQPLFKAIRKFQQILGRKLLSTLELESQSQEVRY